MLNDASVSTTVPLIDIQSAEFAEQYELGRWWSMYGDEQGKGPVSASYLTIAPSPSCMRSTWGRITSSS